MKFNVRSVDPLCEIHAVAGFACLLLVFVEPSAWWVSSVAAREPGCVFWGSMTHETSFADIFDNDPLGIENSQ